MWNFDHISELVDRAVAGDRTLSPATLVLCMSALSKMDFQGQWIDDNGALGDDDFDTVDNWVATALFELMIESETTMSIKRALLAHKENTGTHGGTLTAGNNIRPLNTIVSDADSLISSLTSNYFYVAQSGLYRVFAMSHTYGQTISSLALYKSGQYLLESPYSADNHQVILGYVELAVSTAYNFYVYGNTTRANDGLGRAQSVQLSGEIYAIVELELIE